VTCKKSDIESHVKSCTFGLESSQNDNSEVLDEDYEVVCPNSILGCKYTGGKHDLQEHLSDGCAFKGKTRQEEQEERHLMRQTVINNCEVERIRRLAEDKNNVKRSRHLQRSESSPPPSQATRALSSGVQARPIPPLDGSSAQTSIDEGAPPPVGTEEDPETEDKGDQQILTLHLLMEKQMNYVVTGLHNEALQFWEHWREKQAQRRPMEIILIQNLRKCMHKLWNFASLEPFGSWATGLPGMRSDIDLVVCFENDILLTKTPTSRNDLLRKLANFLERHAKDLITITKVLLHTRVPLIKALARMEVPCDSSSSSSSSSSSAGGTRVVIVELDISIDGPEHSGLATTSLSQAMLKALPGLGPATMLIKEYLKEKGLCDSFTGGLASYGTFLLVCLLFLRRYHANQLAVEDKQEVSEGEDQEIAHALEGSEVNDASGVSGNKETKTVPPTRKTLQTKKANKSCGQRGTLDKSFSSEFLFSDSLSPSPSLSPPPPCKDVQVDAAITKENTDSALKPEIPDLDRSTSDPSPYSFINVKQQKEYGRRVAAKLLLNPADYDDQVCQLLII
jgi:predicted nucleotidyltransferase